VRAEQDLGENSRKDTKKWSFESDKGDVSKTKNWKMTRFNGCQADRFDGGEALLEIGGW